MASHPLLARIGIDLPIFQAPMAGTSTPAMAAAVSNAGALGALGLAAEKTEGAGRMIAATRELPQARLAECRGGSGMDRALPA